MKRNQISLRAVSPLAFLLLLVISGCSSNASNNATSSDNSKKPQRVAVIISTLNNPWFVVLRVANNPRRACLELGVVVDNTVREAVGVKASDFANSQDFNAISSELNRRVEQEVIAPNRALLKPGVVAEFVGCAKVGGRSDLDPLCLIPIRLEVRGNGPGDTASTDVADGETSP